MPTFHAHPYLSSPFPAAPAPATLQNLPGRLKPTTQDLPPRPTPTGQAPSVTPPTSHTSPAPSGPPTSPPAPGPYQPTSPAQALHASPTVQDLPPRPSPAARRQGLSFLVHAPAKAGKSTFGDSGPQPRLILDIEGTAVWTPSRKTEWSPRQGPPPQQGRRVVAGYGQPSVTPDWETCLVVVRDAATIAEAYRVLNAGRHPFNSLSVDSLTEGQQRVIDNEVGIKKVERDNWGHLLRVMGLLVRQHRDLLIHPVKPLWSVTFIAGTHMRDGKWRPLVQGQLQDYLPYYVDVEGYLNANADGTRDLLIGPHPDYETGERVGGRLPYAPRLGYPGRVAGWDIESMLRKVLSD